MSALWLEAARAHVAARIAKECRETAELGPQWALQTNVIANPHFAIERLAYGFAETFTLELRRFEIIEGETVHLLAGWAVFGPWPDGYPS